MTENNGLQVASSIDVKLAQLRAPFPAEVVGKLPKIACSACTKSSTKNCEKHSKSKCAVCNNWITTAHVHLDYVSHADVTDRLLSVDPLWSWEPLAFDETGMPKFIEEGRGPVGLWIRLTVLGVTRLGYGSVAPGAFDAEKQLIGDALRNAAMRFGVALALWAKSDLESQIEVAPEERRPAPKASAAPAGKLASPDQNREGIDEARRAAGGTIRRPSPARKPAASDTPRQEDGEEAKAKDASVEPADAGAAASPPPTSALRDQPSRKFPPAVDKLRADVAALSRDQQAELRKWLQAEGLPEKGAELTAEQLPRVVEWVRTVQAENDRAASEMRVS